MKDLFGYEIVNPAQKEIREEIDPEIKIRKAIRLIRSANSQHNYTVAFSGGKDSVVLSYLTKEAGVKLPHVYNLTTIDPVGNTEFCRKNQCEIKKPKFTFRQLVRKKGLPTQFRRFCCEFLKEQYVSDFLMTGVRRDESQKRAKYYCSFEDTYKYSKKLITQRLHPLIYFTTEDIRYIIESRQLECHPLYYDDKGRFCVERRLGCQGCPLKSDRGVSDFLKNPKLLASIAKQNILFHQEHGRTSYDAYLNHVYVLFYSNNKYENFLQTYHGFFNRDPKQFMEEYFYLKLP